MPDLLVSTGRRLAAIVLALALVFIVTTGGVRAAWDEIRSVVGLQGRPAPASANVLSEHHLESLNGMPPQVQAEFLLERSINHYDGANGEIERRIPSWHGRIEPSDHFETLFRMAINSDDLRVRAAAIEIDIVARKLEQSADTVDRLEPIAVSGAQGPRANALWDLGLIGSRGVEQARIAQILQASLHDDNVNVRYWAVEGLGYLASDAVIDPLLEVFHDDASPMIRERAACNLSQSGMLTREQRMKAVPRLLDDSADFSMDEQTRSWAFQALRDITGQNLPHDPSAWRQWYERPR
ncbi:MAG TPA: HEAT repeat domain-containing protein [Vicinamibacterales bacterium]|nr:HEAT repeat domain-containing protein [Vicinamibacterales bacterium]